VATHIPNLGDWYKDLAVHRLFQIAALDEYSATIDIQYQDGEIDQCDLENWSLMAVARCDPPEDWLNLLDVNEDQHLFIDGVFVRAGHQFDWQFGWDEF